MARERLARRPRRDAEAIHQIPWRQPVNRLPPVEVLSADQVEAIHNASLRVLEDIGMEVLNDRALEIFHRAGAAVDRGAQHVRLDRGLVAEAVAKAPPSFRLHARNAERSV